MNLKVEEILMVFVAFLIGWFLRTMTTSENNNSVIKSYGAKHESKNESARAEIQRGIREAQAAKEAVEREQGTLAKTLPNEEWMRTHREDCFEENGNLKTYITGDHNVDNGYAKGCGIVTNGKRCEYQDDCTTGICAETCAEPDYCNGDTMCLASLNPETCRKIDDSNKCHRLTKPN